MKTPALARMHGAAVIQAKPPVVQSWGNNPVGPPMGFIIVKTPEFETRSLFPSAGAFVQDVVFLTDRVELLHEKIDLVREELADLTEKLSFALEFPASSSPNTKVFETEDELREAVATYFRQHHGETLYPSDVVAEFGLAYEKAVDVITSLEANGCIRRN